MKKKEAERVIELAKLMVKVMAALVEQKKQSARVRKLLDVLQARGVKEVGGEEVDATMRKLKKGKRVLDHKGEAVDAINQAGGVGKVPAGSVEIVLTRLLEITERNTKNTANIAEKIEAEMLDGKPR